MLSIALTEHLLLLMFQCCCCQHPYGHNQCYIVLKVAHGDTAEHTPKPVYNAEEAGEQGQEFGPDPTDPEGIAESPEPVDPDFPEPIKSKTAVVQPESDAGLENLLFLSSNAVKQYNENCGGDACIICWSADRGIISLPCGHQATCK